MATSARREPEDRRRELLDAAVDEAQDTGLVGLLPADVAARAGRSKALVFHYFDSTAGLRRDVAAITIAELDVALRPPPGLPAAERPAHLVRAFLDAVTEHGRIWQDIWNGALATDPATRDALDAVRGALVERMSLTATAIGFTPSARLTALARGWVALVETMTADWLDPATDHPLPRADLEAMLVASLAVLAPELPEPARSAVLALAEPHRTG